MRILRVTLWMLLLFTSCKKELQDYESPDRRLTELLNSYEEALVNSPDGWIGYLYPKGGGSYTFKFYFDPANRVRMYADFREDYAAAFKESSYRFKVEAVISLYFDTYSYIHELSDPNPAVIQGVVGQGLVSDFEFSVLALSGDTMSLRGNHNESELILVRAQPEQGESYVQTVYAMNEYIRQLDAIPWYFKQLEFAGQTFMLSLNNEIKTFSLYYTSQGQFQSFSTQFIVTDQGIRLREAFTFGGESLSELTDFIFDLTAQTATVRINNSTTALLTTVRDAPIIDPQAAIDFFVNTYIYRSSSGFTINGVTDYYSLREVPSFTSLSYEPRYYIDNYDVLLLNFGVNFYGGVFQSHAGNNGIIVFDNLLGFTGVTPGGVHTNKVVNSAALWVDPQGYYVVKTGNNAYDLVQVANPNIWIRFK